MTFCTSSTRCHRAALPVATAAKRSRLCGRKKRLVGLRRTSKSQVRHWNPSPRACLRQSFGSQNYSTRALSQIRQATRLGVLYGYTLLTALELAATYSSMSSILFLGMYSHSTLSTLSSTPLGSGTTVIICCSASENGSCCFLVTKLLAF